MAVQRRNSEMIDLLAADFQARYEPQFAWKSACSQFQALTGLRGFWPTSSLTSAGHMIDLSGHARTLTLQGNPVYGTDQLAPYVELDGTGDYFIRNDEPGLDITGTEAYVDPAYQGLMIGGWYRFMAAAGANEFMMSKWDSVGDERSYGLYRQAAGLIRFAVSSAGTAATVTTVTTPNAPDVNEWFFAAARFSNVNNEIKVWYNDETATAVYNDTIWPGTADFIIGGAHGGVSLMTGRFAFQFPCAAASPDAVVGQLYQQSRAAFNV